MKIRQQPKDGLFAKQTDGVATEQRPANRKRAMNTTNDFYRRLMQRRDAARRRASFLDRLLWRWR